jgi:two-component system C4-dicarboxylate transport response regulator DctD
MVERSNERVSLLAVLPDAADRDSLCGILRPSNWKLDFAKTYDEACAALRAADPGPIVTDCSLPGGFGWRDLLELARSIQNAPPVIVTDRFADERLWAEVLNEGGYDVLMKPFEPEEVLRIVRYAWQAWNDRARQAAARRKPLSSAAAPGAESLYAGVGS